jgi:hypothetical protein
MISYEESNIEDGISAYLKFLQEYEYEKEEEEE